MKITKQQLKDVRNNYRIITNGIKYRIEKHKVCGILWWKERKWIQLCVGNDDNVSHILDFHAKEDAIKTMDFCIKEDLAQIRGWEEVKQ